MDALQLAPLILQERQTPTLHPYYYSYQAVKLNLGMNNITPLLGKLCWYSFFDQLGKYPRLCKYPRPKITIILIIIIVIGDVSLQSPHSQNPNIPIIINNTPILPLLIDS